MKPEPKTVEAHIQKLVHGGSGFARIPEVCLIPFSMPGDRGQITTAEPPSGYWTELSEPSPYRIEPKCDVFAECGGCHWQFMRLETQHFWKQQILAETFRRVGKLPMPYPVSMFDTARTEAWQYRNKATYRVVAQGAGGFKLAFVGVDATTRVSPPICWLVPEVLQQAVNAIESVSEAWPTDVPLPTDIVLRFAPHATKNAIVLALLGNTLPTAGLTAWAQTVRQAHPPLMAMACQPKAGQCHSLMGEPWLLQPLGGQAFRVSADSFFQVNLPAAEAMLASVQAWAGEGESLLDLYAGVGVFSACLSEQFKRLSVVESHPAAVRDAKYNLRQLPAERLDIIPFAAERSLAMLPTKPDVAIIDPPRSGIDKSVRQWLVKHVRKRMIVISCEPSTLARDLADFTAHGWRLSEAQPIDMFPQTYHVECVCLLERA